MDLIYKRYANPLEIIDQFISSSMLCKFIRDIVQINEDDKLWELYLHRCFLEDISFDGFKARCNGNPKHKTTNNDVKTTILNSKNILENFKKH